MKIAIDLRMFNQIIKIAWIALLLNVIALYSQSLYATDDQAAQSQSAEEQQEPTNKTDADAESSK